MSSRRRSCRGARSFCRRGSSCSGVGAGRRLSGRLLFGGNLGGSGRRNF